MAKEFKSDESKQLDELIKTVAELIGRIEKLDTRMVAQERAMLTLTRRIRLHSHPLPGRFNTSTSAVELPSEAPPEGS